MSQDDNPYASPRTSHEPRIADGKTWGQRVAGFVLYADASLCLLALIVGIMGLALIPGGSLLFSFPVLASTYLPPCLGLLAYALLMRKGRMGLSIAYCAGLSSILAFFVMLLLSGTMLYSDFIAIGIVRSAWSVAYLHAARSFAKK